MEVVAIRVFQGDHAARRHDGCSIFSDITTLRAEFQSQLLERLHTVEREIKRRRVDNGSSTPIRVKTEPVANPLPRRTSQPVVIDLTLSESDTE